MRVTLQAEELDVLKGFLEEAWEHLEGIEDKILELENDQDPDTVNAAFRPVHTIKGTAAFLGLSNIKELCHETETVLDLIRKGKLGVTNEIVDVLLQAVDTLSQMLKATEDALDNVTEEGKEVVLEIEEVPFEEVVQSLQAIKEQGPSEGTEETRPSEAAQKPSSATPPTEPSYYRWAPAVDVDLSGVSFPPGLLEEFLDESEEHLQNIEDLLLKFEKGEGKPEEINELFRALHTLKGNSGILISTLEDEALLKAHPAVPFQQIAHLAESLIQKRRDREELPSPEEIDFLLQVTSVLKNLLENIAKGERPEAIELVLPGGSTAPSARQEKGETQPVQEESQQEASLQEARLEVLINTLSQALEAVEVGLKEILQKEKRETAFAKVGRALEMMVKVAQEMGEEKAREEAEKAYNIIDFLSNNEEPEEHEELLLEGVKEELEVFKELLKRLTTLKQSQEETSPPPKPEVSKASKAPKAAKPAKSTKGEGRNKQVIKVPQERLDKLMNLIGELVVVKNNFSILARELSVEYNLPGLAKKIKEFGAGVSRIVDELQATIMSIRMVPVGQVFSRFPRMVRDLSRKLNKKVKLIITGEETELDKTIIEALGDPLVHLIRNAMDHGLEPPEERQKLGKPEEGNIWLRAYNKGQSVIIEIEDDGRGIDPQKVRLKAMERGLITEEDLERLDDQQIINLIFQPGFSTAEKVSEVSGRGVGMDVVRTAIEKIGGSVELQSELGKGTKVILKLPLTLAISKGLEVEVLGERFYIPLDYVVETVKAPKEAIHWHRGRALVVIRDELLPMLDLGEALGESSFEKEDAKEIPLVVLNLGNRRLVLRVDRFYNESEFVLKPLVGPLEGLPGFSGATVTGEGKILLVLDPPKLLS